MDKFSEKVSRGLPILEVPPAVPHYLSRNYWWAYVHPWAVAFWDHLWIVNLILLTNYRRLRDAALQEFGMDRSAVLQIACVYGDLSPMLADRVIGAGGTLDIVDVLPIQLANAECKFVCRRDIRLHNMDSTKLFFPTGHYDCAMLFFLLHEQPQAVRAKTLAEAFRVLKPSGKLVIVDFAKPHWWNPFRYLWYVFLGIMEPFALDLWRWPLKDILPLAYRDCSMTETRFFGGLFQKVVIRPLRITSIRSHP